ncbi:FliH/SctL family protein [Nocardioides yefusunii]|uniref:FliH/SctL family protein n=1 Tax=Nocardioides yefusunii TaxID=2500546 RepID=A0ABW1R0J1_9ACTN|nr:FliH/SctL family protein [Nocardioides yefusunii]
MSSSTEPVRVVTDLRQGDWTRLAPGSALGDPIAERTLATVAEHARDAARAQGYAVGWAQGRREAAEAAEAGAELEARRIRREAEQREIEHREAIDALKAAAAELRAVIDGAVARVEEQAVEVAWTLTEALVGHEVRGTEAPDVVAKVLALSPQGRLARVRLNPEHASHPALKELKEHGVVCIGDPSLGRADALVHVEDKVLDLRLGPALDRVREVLR